MDSLEGHILTFFLASPTAAAPHKFSRGYAGDVKAKEDDVNVEVYEEKDELVDDIKNKTDETLEEDEDVNVNEETDAGNEFVDTENIKGKEDYENQNVKQE